MALFSIDVFHHFPDAGTDLVLAKLEELHKQGERIMSAVSDFAGKVNTAFASIATAVDGIKADVDGLKAKIQELQDSAGTLSPEDQASLDAIQAQAESVASKLTDLDNATEAPPAP